MAGRHKDPNSRTEFVGIRFSKAERQEIEAATNGQEHSVFIREAALARARGGRLKLQGSRAKPAERWRLLGGDPE